MIQVSNLTKRYGNFKAVDNISFKLRKGEILGFLGPNGAGKTTTMRIITGYLSANAGEVSVAGHDIFTSPLAVKRNIGYLPETPPVYRDMRVRDYLNFCGKIKGLSGYRDRKRRLNYVLERCGLEEVHNVHIHKLSKGYRQRVGLAQALIHNPPVLILDEPTAGLDPHQIIGVRELIRQLAGEHSILLSTHILPEASLTCDRVLIIDRGLLLAEDTTERLTGKLTGHDVVRVLLKGAPAEIRDRLGAVEGVVKVDEQQVPGGRKDGLRQFDVSCKLGNDRRGELARAVVESGAQLLELRPESMTLEEIFIKITTRTPDELAARSQQEGS
ncbi:MAG: ATP-binding cassette domain-containing protein [Candidatus Glassbacteria bacterium]|nr:ATP-binding cassette domain-containing protein [Candidatus Glassbacteria bacterium]